MAGKGFVTVELKRGEQISRDISKMVSTAPRSVSKAMYTSGQRFLVKEAKQRLRKGKNIFRGELSQKVAVKRTFAAGGGSGRGAAVELLFGAIGVPYGMDVEKGSGPRKVSSSEFQKLVDYAQKKMGASPDGAARLAQAIKQTIEEVGTKPYPFIETTWKSNESRFWADVLKRTQADIKKGM